MHYLKKLWSSSDEKWANNGTIFIDHASDYVFTFIQTKNRGVQTVEDKCKFETFAKICSTSAKNYHFDKIIFNSQIFKESCITNK